MSRVWASWDSGSDGDLWWESDGSDMTTAEQNPPDTDAWYIGDLGPNHPPAPAPIWIPGGMDVTHVYHVVMSYTGQWYVDVFNSDISALEERWIIPGWSGINYEGAVGEGVPYWYLDPFAKTMSVGPTRMIVVSDVFNPGLISVEVAVLDLVGTHLATWTWDASAGFDGVSSCGNATTCLNQGCTHAFFSIMDGDSDEAVAKVDLATGDFEILFKMFDLGGFGFSNCQGLISVGDDLITCEDGLARVHQDGSVVWFSDDHLSMGQYQGLGHSGRGTLWVGEEDTAMLQEFSYNGEFLQQIGPLPESAIHIWGLESQNPLRLFQRDDTLGPGATPRLVPFQTSKQGSSRIRGYE